MKTFLIFVLLFPFTLNTPNDPQNVESAAGNEANPIVSATTAPTPAPNKNEEPSNENTISNSNEASNDSSDGKSEEEVNDSNQNGDDGEDPKEKLTTKQRKDKLLEKSIDADGKLCITFQNDAEPFSAQLKSLLTEAGQKLDAVPRPVKGVEESNMYWYKIVENVQYKDIFHECQKLNLDVFSANSEEEKELLLPFMRRAVDREGQSPQARDIFWIPTSGNEVNLPIYNLRGQEPHVNNWDIKGKTNGLQFVHPEPQDTSFTKCSAVERKGRLLSFVARACANNAAVLCLRRKDFLGTWAADLKDEKQPILTAIKNAIKGTQDVAAYIKSIKSPKCRASKWTEKFSDLIKRHFPYTQEVERLNKITLTNVLLRFPQLKQLTNLLVPISKLAKGKIGEMIQKVLLGPFVEISMSSDEKIICICPKVKFLKEINDFFEKMASLNSWFDVIEIDNQIRLPELILTFVTTLALVVAIAGLCVQRRHVKLKEKKHKHKREKEKRKINDIELQSAQTSPITKLSPNAESEKIETPKSQKSVKFSMNIFKRKPIIKKTEYVPREIEVNNFSPSSSSSSQSSDSLSSSSSTSSEEKIKTFV